MGSQRFEKVVVCPRIAGEPQQTKASKPCLLISKLVLFGSSLHKGDWLHDGWKMSAQWCRL